MERLQKELEAKHIYCMEMEQKNNTMDERIEVLSKQLNETCQQCETLRGRVVEYETNTELLNSSVDELSKTNKI